MHWYGVESRDVLSLTGDYNIVYLICLNDKNKSTIFKAIQFYIH